MEKIEPQAPYVVILEHPAPNASRFRYESEGRLAGSIYGVNSTLDNKTYPAIQVKNYVGRAVVVVSCVTKDAPHKPHPHNVVGREGCNNGVCQYEIDLVDMTMVFTNLGIQCVKRRGLVNSLKAREKLRVDPYRTGFSHREQTASIDLNAVRLCFQVFLEGPNEGEFKIPLEPVVSNTIHNKKTDPKIMRLSHCNAPCNGGQDMILLCEKVEKDDIEIVFFEGGWEGLGVFPEIHKATAIYFRTPPFKSVAITEPMTVKIQLRRPSDKVKSQPLNFEMLPISRGPICIPIVSDHQVAALCPPQIPYTVPIGAVAQAATSGSLQRQISNIFPNYNQAVATILTRNCIPTPNGISGDDMINSEELQACIDDMAVDTSFTGMDLNTISGSLSEEFRMFCRSE